MADRVLAFEQRTLQLMADHHPQPAAILEFPRSASGGQE
jgi:hypothetical protein